MLNIIILSFSSPGYGLFLSAETTEGVVYHGEALSRPKGEAGDPIVPEEVGESAAAALLEEIYRVSLLDVSLLGCSLNPILLLILSVHGRLP